jgi:hypothetical protein
VKEPLLRQLKRLADRVQNAISAARQALQESLMGGKQRFGSASNIYKALGEYGTTKFQQASGQANEIAEKTYRTLAEQTQQLNESYTTAVMSLKKWGTEQMTLAQNEFQSKLLEIEANRNEATQNKSFQKIQLLQDMRNRADAIKNQLWTFNQNLEMQRQAYAQQISATASQFSGAASTGANNASASASNQIAGIDMAPLSAAQQVNY